MTQQFYRLFRGEIRNKRGFYTTEYCETCHSSVSYNSLRIVDFIRKKIKRENGIFRRQ